MQRKTNKGKGNVKNRLVNLTLVSLFMLIALALGVNADCNASIDATINVGTELNVTYNISGATGLDNVFVAFLCQSADTANNSYSKIANISNTTARLFTNLTIGDLGVLSIEDDDSYSCRAVCYFNATKADEWTENSSVVTGRTFDRGNVPSVPTTLRPSGTLENRNQQFEATVNGVNTSQCTLNFIGRNPGSSAYSMVHSGDNCSLAFTNFPSQTFVFTITASDGTNSSQPSAEQTMSVDVKTGTSKKAYIISGGALPPQASTTAQQKTKGQQASASLDKVIAKAPPQAQAGLTKAKESITKQYKGKEATKTWVGTGVGCGAGAIGLVIPPVGLITIPAGCIAGHLVGLVV